MLNFTWSWIIFNLMLQVYWTVLRLKSPWKSFWICTLLWNLWMPIYVRYTIFVFLAIHIVSIRVSVHCYWTYGCQFMSGIQFMSFLLSTFFLSVHTLLWNLWMPIYVRYTILCLSCYPYRFYPSIYTLLLNLWMPIYVRYKILCLTCSPHCFYLYIVMELMDAILGQVHNLCLSCYHPYNILYCTGVRLMKTQRETAMQYGALPGSCINVL